VATLLGSARTHAISHVRPIGATERIRIRCSTGDKNYELVEIQPETSPSSETVDLL